MKVTVKASNGLIGLNKCCEGESKWKSLRLCDQSNPK